MLTRTKQLFWAAHEQFNKLHSIVISLVAEDLSQLYEAYRTVDALVAAVGVYTEEMLRQASSLKHIPDSVTKHSPKPMGSKTDPVERNVSAGATRDVATGASLEPQLPDKVRKSSKGIATTINRELKIIVQPLANSESPSQRRGHQNGFSQKLFGRVFQDIIPRNEHRNQTKMQHRPEDLTLLFIGDVEQRCITDTPDPIGESEELRSAGESRTNAGIQSRTWDPGVATAPEATQSTSTPEQRRIHDPARTPTNIKLSLLRGLNGGENATFHIEGCINKLCYLVVRGRCEKLPKNI